MDIERMLVSKVAQTQSMTAVMERNIEPTHFLQRAKGDTNKIPLPGEVYGWMVQHLRKYKAVPSPGLTQQRWPLFQFLDSSDPLEVLRDQFVAMVKRRELIQGIRNLSAIADDPTKWGEAEIYAFEVAADLARAVPASSITRLSDSIHRLKLNQEMERIGRAPGITLVGRDLDALTYGIQPGELCIWQGFSGGGKSTMTMIQSATEYIERDKTSLVLSLEMDGGKLASRWDAAMAGFRYKSLKFMEMRDEDYEKWARFAEKAHAARFEKDILVRDDIQRCTPELIFTEVEKWQPHFFIVDTVDEIRAPSYLKSHWEQQDYAARELKAICRVTKRPGIGVAQAGRDAEEDGAKLSNMAGSITIVRKADLVVGLHSNPQMKRANKLELRMLKNRDGEGDGLAYDYFRDPATLTLRPWTPADAAPPPPPRGQPNQTPDSAPPGPPQMNAVGAPVASTPFYTPQPAP